MTEKGEDNPMNLDPLRERYTLINEGEIEHFLGGDPTAISILLEAQKVVGSYFPNASLTLEYMSYFGVECQHLLVLIHTPDMDPKEAAIRLERLDQESLFATFYPAISVDTDPSTYQHYCAMRS